MSNTIFNFIPIMMTLLSCNNSNISSSSTPDTCQKCNIQAVQVIEKNIDSLQENEIYFFLCSFGNECRDNVEFREYSNEILFELIKNYPHLFIKEMAANDDIEKEAIYLELESPISDAVDIEYIINSLKPFIQKSKYKNVGKNIMQSLENALSKQ